MVVFEGKAFDEKKVISIETGENTTWSRGVKDRYYIIMKFDNGESIIWDRYLPETAISKVNKIATLINNREEELLKLTNS